MKRFVYLAGPILNQTEKNANDWRILASGVLTDNHITGISPLRQEPSHRGRYGFASVAKGGGGANAIWAKNEFDMRNCDMALAYLPQWSAGTLMEIGYLWAIRKPIVLVTTDVIFQKHPCLLSAAGWVFDNLEDGVMQCVALLSGYVGGKNV